MRTIKFRAWDGEAMSEVLLPHGPATASWLIQHLPVLMQFTGLLDKNGKEIYEGDVVSCSLYSNAQTHFQREYSVTWNAEGYWELASDIRMFNSSFGDVAKHKGTTEIIGNIYENQDLLTQHNSEV